MNGLLLAFRSDCIDEWNSKILNVVLWAPLSSTYIQWGAYNNKVLVCWNDFNILTPCKWFLFFPRRSFLYNSSRLFPQDTNYKFIIYTNLLRYQFPLRDVRNISKWPKVTIYLNVIVSNHMRNCSYTTRYILHVSVSTQIPYIPSFTRQESWGAEVECGNCKWKQNKTPSGFSTVHDSTNSKSL